jgi:hypothetical protein
MGRYRPKGRHKNDKRWGGEDMPGFDRELLQQIMQNELNYKEPDIKRINLLVEKLNPGLHEVLGNWVNYRTVPPVEVEGVTLDLIMTKNRCDFLNALIYMNAFVEKPELAKKYLKAPMHFM